MRHHVLCLTILGIAAAAGPLPAAGPADANGPRLYVPYKDVASLIGPADRAVLMDRQAFDKLLTAAKANEQAVSGREIAQITDAAYQAQVRGEEITLTGSLTVVSLSDRPVAVPLGFGQIGLSRIALDGKGAPLGYDKQGRLVLIVTKRGPHALSVAGSARLKELAGGGCSSACPCRPPRRGRCASAHPATWRSTRRFRWPRRSTTSRPTAQTSCWPSAGTTRRRWC